MKNSIRNHVFYLTAACALTAFSAGCSTEWITGGAPDVPEGAYIADKVVVDPVEPPPAAPVTPIEAGTVVDIVPESGVQGGADLVVVDASKNIPVIPDIQYKVQKNDTLSGIAAIYGVPTGIIANYNNIGKNAILQPGQILLIPADQVTAKNAKSADAVKTYVAPKAPEPPQKAAPAKALKPVAEGDQVIHVVKKNEILGTIALAYGVRVADITAANGIDVKSVLRIDQKLIIPSPKKKPTSVATVKDVKKAKAVKKDVKKAAASQPKVAPKAPAAAAPAAAPVVPATTPVDPAAAPAPAVPAELGSVDDLLGVTPAPAPAAPAKEAAAPAKEAAAPAKEAVPTPESSVAPTETFEFTVIQPTTLTDFAKQMGYKLDTLLKLNPGVTATEKLESNRVIILPALHDIAL